VREGKGEEGNRMYFIRRGSVEVLKGIDDKSATRQLAILNEGTRSER